MLTYWVEVVVLECFLRCHALLVIKAEELVEEVERVVTGEMGIVIVDEA